MMREEGEFTKLTEQEQDVRALSRALVLVGVVHISHSLQCKIEQDMRP